MPFDINSVLQRFPIFSFSISKDKEEQKVKRISREQKKLDIENTVMI